MQFIRVRSASAGTLQISDHLHHHHHLRVSRHRWETLDLTGGISVSPVYKPVTCAVCKRWVEAASKQRHKRYHLEVVHRFDFEVISARLLHVPLSPKATFLSTPNCGTSSRPNHKFGPVTFSIALPSQWRILLVPGSHWIEFGEWGRTNNSILLALESSHLRRHITFTKGD